jgi:hypothetical protein
MTCPSRPVFASRAAQSPKDRRSARSVVLRAGAAMGVTLGLVTPTLANDNPAFLQWFETSWSNMERRMPDLFLAGYGGLWLPPISKASDGSPGYDPFDRFDIGTPESPTIYGTEARFKQVVQEFQAAGAAVYIDLIMNHNGGRTDNAAFIADGAWPQFYLPGTPGAGFWGDFHNGLTQSENPSPGPGAEPYNLFEGDLVNLIDINQASNFAFIRQPVEADAQNIPPGNVRNRPNPANRRFYPDRQATPLTFVNPAPRGDGASWTVYPFTADVATTGDPIVENATGLLMRSAQWYLDELKVDGFRLDAAKHIPQWFWNNFYDPIVFNRRVLPSGQRVVPFSFGESVAGNDFVQTYIRKDGFGNRDALDLNEAGALRDIRANGGFRSWLQALNASIDTQDDGFNNGTQGVHHVYSHDNGSTGGGSAAPGVPTFDLYALPQFVYVLFRTGVPKVYYNGREMHDRFVNRGFWPREGSPTALGNTDTNLSRLVRLRNGYARGDMFVLNGTDTTNPSLDDVLIFERAQANLANVLVGVNDRNDGGTQLRNVQTRFNPGTRLQELSGTASDPVVNNQGFIQQILVVDANRRVSITVPNNRNSAGVFHGRGYVVYGPLAPQGGITVSPVASTIPADPASVPTYRRRLASADVVTAPTFELRLTTFKGDPLENNNDDFAVFRFNRGWQDLNSNGAVDLLPPGATVDAGYERFLTQFSPISGPSGTNSTGTYRQTIDTSRLPEGFNYVNVIAYRRRTEAGASPLYTDFRKVIYVDRVPPNIRLVSGTTITDGNFQFRVRAENAQGVPDRTVDSVHVLANVPVGADPVPLCNPSNQASQYDRFEWRRNVGNLPIGTNSITIVAFEPSGNVAVQRVEGVTVSLGSGDINRDGLLTIDDLYASWALTAYQGEADTNRNGLLDANDRKILEEQVIRQGEAAKMRATQR